ncbi:hypothetical protein AA958_18840 [Streptomyces sp. CNQ-509]|uniref:hypothetical protein n=1 Tax=Streptomyces sp. CNQ-509 TaxID=444103 RepID=UPI00062DE727|nr:hypothetical protein [Streptomyces sp. CNQ-509]AKH83913.1 hypothetical protein AA958_18840 [Streptomyces sp. CNQ-509]
MNLTAPAEHLLDLAQKFTCHNDDLARLRVTLARHGLSGSSPATALTDHAAVTQRLANAALDIVDVLKAQPMYLSPAIRTVYARVWQLAYLVSDSTDHLLDAVDIIDDTRAAIPGLLPGAQNSNEAGVHGADEVSGDSGGVVGKVSSSLARCRTKACLRRLHDGRGGSGRGRTCVRAGVGRDRCWWLSLPGEARAAGRG